MGRKERFMKTEEEIKQALVDLPKNLHPMLDRIKTLIDSNKYDQAVEELNILTSNLIGAVIAQDIINN